MCLKKGLILGIALVLAISGASATLASSLSLEVYFTDGAPNGFGGLGHLYYGAGGGASIESQPTTAGPFSQQAYGTVNFETWTETAPILGTSRAPEGATIVLPVGGGWVDIRYGLNQEGPLRFTDATWTISFIDNDTGETIFSRGGPYWFSGPSIDGMNSGSCFFTEFQSGPYVEIETPILWNELDRSPDWTTGCNWADAYVNYTLRLEVTGNLIDTTAHVPLPPTLLLLGSGLVGLGTWRACLKRKFIVNNT